MRDFLLLLPNQNSLQDHSENAIWLLVMSQLKDVLDRYSAYLGTIQAALKDKKVKKEPIRVLLGISKPSIYRKREDVALFTFDELALVGEYLEISREPLNDYLALLTQLNEIIKRSKWKKQGLMEAMNIPASRSALLTRNPNVWRLNEVEKLIELLSTTDDV